MMDDGKRIRVLYFDDEEVLREVVSAILTGLGFEVCAFKSFDSCLLSDPQSSHLRPGESFGDVIISDLHMPSKATFKFLEKQISTGFKANHIALTSGFCSEEDENHAVSLGLKLLGKPFGVHDLKAWLMEISREINLNRKLVDPHQSEPPSTECQA